MSKRRALLLSSLMLRGYGVAVVAEQLSKRLEQHGWELFIGCLMSDESSASNKISVIQANESEILNFCRAQEIEIVIAQTSPYFEVLPAIQKFFPTIAYDFGDPAPYLFDHDKNDRAEVRQHKIDHVYPKIGRVLTISEFLRHDIGWPEAGVLYLGADHVANLGTKPSQLPTRRSSQALRVGTLMRLGEGESKYKGNELMRQIISELQDLIQVQPAVLGRGQNSDAVEWQEAGFEVFLNATDDERRDYLRNLDVFISPSLWEGFNLPLVEAQALGTVGIAFDTGAHPETTPFLASSVFEVVEMLNGWSTNLDQLEKVSNLSYSYVSGKFQWDKTASGLAAHLDEVCRLHQRKGRAAYFVHRIHNGVSRLWRLFQREGLLKGLRKICGRLLHLPR